MGCLHRHHGPELAEDGFHFGGRLGALAYGLVELGGDPGLAPVGIGAAGGLDALGVDEGRIDGAGDRVDDGEVVDVGRPDVDTVIGVRGLMCGAPCLGVLDTVEPLMRAAARATLSSCW